MGWSDESVIPGGDLQKVTILWFIIGILIGSGIGFVLFYIFYNLKKKVKPENFDPISGDISQLIGKIQHVTSVNVDTLEKKISELRSTIHLANQVYAKLNENLSDKMNDAASSEKNSHKEHIVHLQSYEPDIDEKIIKTSTKEEKIIELKKKGWDVKKIAESLDMGIGEVELVIRLNFEDKKEEF